MSSETDKQVHDHIKLIEAAEREAERNPDAFWATKMGIDSDREELIAYPEELTSPLARRLFRSGVMTAIDLVSGHHSEPDESRYLWGRLSVVTETLAREYPDSGVQIVPDLPPVRGINEWRSGLLSAGRQVESTRIANRNESIAKK